MREELSSWELEARDVLLVGANREVLGAESLMFDVGDGDEGRLQDGNIDERYCMALSKRLSMAVEMVGRGKGCNPRGAQEKMRDLRAVARLPHVQHGTQLLCCATCVPVRVCGIL